MKKKTLIIIAAGGLAATGMAAWCARQKSIKKTLRKAGRWHAVTVNRPMDAVDPEQLPEPLARLGEAVEVRTQAAPANRGTELIARLTGRQGKSSLRAVREALRMLQTALRDAKQSLETGEVLQADKPPAPRRTSWSLPLQRATRLVKGGSRL